MTMPMVIGATVSVAAMRAVTTLLENGKKKLRTHIHLFIDQFKTGNVKNNAKELHAVFTILKLRFNNILDQLDIFADVLSQRSEHEVGIWLAGLDVLAEDGLLNVKDFVSTLPRLDGICI